VIAFDTTYLIVLLQDKAVPSITDRQGKPVSKARERVQYLVQKLSESSSIICIPTPVLAEIMVRAGSAGPAYLKRFSDSSKFKLSAFDVRAAVEAAELIRLVKDEQSKKIKVDTWAKMKFDIQIVAIAKAEACGAIYSDDPNIENHGNRVRIPVRRICDLQLPSESEGQQPDLFREFEESEAPEVKNETAAVEAVADSALIQGSNERSVKSDPAGQEQQRKKEQANNETQSARVTTPEKAQIRRIRVDVEEDKGVTTSETPKAADKGSPRENGS
jgi:hypothetical protein